MSTESGTGWSKEFPAVRAVRERYWIRAGKQLTILQVNPSGRHEAVGSNTKYLASDFHGWEFLGPISPADAEQLVRLREIIKELERENSDLLRQLSAANAEISRLEAQPSLSDAIKEVEKWRNERERPTDQLVAADLIRDRLKSLSPQEEEGK
jgi:hypothetical protein